MGRYDWEEKSRARQAHAAGGSGSARGNAVLIGALALVLGGGSLLYAGSHSDNAAHPPLVDHSPSLLTAMPSNASKNGDAAATGAAGSDSTDRAASNASLQRTSAATQSVHYQFSHCEGPVRVTCVVDGDTLWLQGTKIRVADIDTPEVSEPKCASEKTLGDRATERFIQLLNAGPFDIVGVAEGDEDKYGRKLRVLVRHGHSIGDQLVAEGLARTWTGRREPWC
jgi:endonuclease YncB( thermonuclease family)